MSEPRRDGSYWIVSAETLVKVRDEAILAIEAEARAAALGEAVERIADEIRGLENVSRETGRAIEDTIRITGMRTALAAIDALREPKP